MAIQGIAYVLILLSLGPLKKGLTLSFLIDIIKLCFV